MKKEDNPVPSLTENDITEIRDILSKYISQFGKSKYRDELSVIYNKLHGVETDNEQPRNITRIMRFYKKLPHYNEFNIKEVLKIAKNIGISRRTAYDYLNYLKNNNLIYQPRMSYYKLIG